MLFNTILALAPLLPGGSQGSYDGRFASHPNLEVLDETLEEAHDVIPDWLAKEIPSISYRIVDQAQEIEVHGWPASLALGSIAREKQAYTIEVPIDSLIADPVRGRGALLRDIVFCVGMETALTSGGGFARMSDLGNLNPVVQATASFLAGELQSEIEYLLSRHLNTDEELEACFADIDSSTATGGSAWTFEGRPVDDVTFLILADYLTPKGKDKKLGELYTAIKRGQPVEGALKEPTKKKLPKLNKEFRKAFTAFLKKRFPSKARLLYREIVAHSEAQAWQAALESAERFLDRYEDSMAAPNAAWLRARALVELDAGLGTLALDEFIETHGSSTGFAWRARLQIRLLAAGAGDRRAARASFEQLERDHGWIPGVQTRANQELEALGD
ncbi:MAG: hypothetical protein ACI8QZ_002698 [Chlamydiales bacterium]|jgi:hypothetical protein